MDYEVFENENMEQENEAMLAEYEAVPAGKTGIGFKGVLVGAAVIAGAAWGAKKLYNKFCKNDEREAKRLEKQAQKLRDAGYSVERPVIIDCEAVEVDAK